MRPKDPPNLKPVASAARIGFLVAMAGGALLFASTLFPKPTGPGLWMAGLTSAGLFFTFSLMETTIRAAKTQNDDLWQIAGLLPDASSDAVWLYAPGHGSFVSQRFHNHFDIPPDPGQDLILEIIERVVPKDAAAAWEAWGNLATHGIPFSVEFKFRDRNGDTLWFRWKAKAMDRPFNRKPLRIYLGSLAFTHQTRVVEEQVNDVALLVVECPTPIFRIDAEGHILLANQSSAPILDAWGVPINGTIPAGMLALLEPVLDSHDKFELEFSCGRQLYGALFAPHGTRGYINVYCTDVTERARINQALDESRKRQQELSERMCYMAQHDPLTKIPNRALFEDRLSMVLEHSRRSGLTMALLVIDLDGFKAANDTYGHDAGDAVLVEVAMRMKGLVRSSDTVARQGGDEFAVIISDLQAIENAAEIARKLIHAIEAPIPYRENGILVSASIGIAIHEPSNQETMAEIYKRGDSALYQAKQEGKRCFRFAPASIEV